MSGLFQFNAGDYLISHTLSRAVPSAQRGLTSVFGMGTGVTLAVCSPANLLWRLAGGSPQPIQCTHGQVLPDSGWQTGATQPKNESHWALLTTRPVESLEHLRGYAAQS
jgi:hypothetical protein